MGFAELCPPGHIAVVTDVHTDEWTSEEQHDLYQLLLEEPIEGVWAVRANELTLQNNRRNGHNDRYTECNMQTLKTKHGTVLQTGYEVSRRNELKIATAAARLILEPHANMKELMYACYSSTASPLVRGVGSHFGAQHALLVGDPYIWAGHPDHIALDFSISKQKNYLADMYALLSKMATGWEPEQKAMREYQAIDSSVTVADARAVGWLSEEKQQFEPFSEADQQKLALLGYPPEAVALGWSYELYGERLGLMGELAAPVAQP